MSFAPLTRLLVLLTVLALAACGGDGGGGAPTTTPPVADAGPAQSALVGGLVTLDGDGSHAASGGALSYAWTLSGKPAGSTATLSDPTAAKPTLTPDVAGNYTASLTVTEGAVASTAATVDVTATAADALTIVADSSEPLGGTVHLSLSGATPGATVTWYADLVGIGTGTTATWNADAAIAGTHLISARIQVSASRTVEIRRVVSVAHPAITIDASIDISHPTLLVDVAATATTGIASVSATFDGQDRGTLTRPNACASTRSCDPSAFALYQFQIDGSTVHSGPHTAIVTVTDDNGAQAQAAVSTVVSNAPALTLDAPADGAFVFGTLHVSGSASSDRSLPVAVTAKLGDTPFLQTTDADFGADFDLSGLAAGSYTLSVLASDGSKSTLVQRTVNVTSSRALAYAPVGTLGAGSSLLATDGTQVVYAGADQRVHLLDTGTSADVVLAGATNSYFGHWQLAGGRVLASSAGIGGCATSSCVYLWQADGTRTILSDLNTASASAQQVSPVAHDGYALWANDTTSYTLYDLASHTFSLVDPDAGLGAVRNAGYDFVVANGVVQVLYAAGTSAGAGSFDIFRWRSDTRTSVRLSTPGQNADSVGADGQRVAWSVSTGAPTTSSLVVAPLGGGAPGTVSTTMGTFSLADGVLAWSEGTTVVSSSIKASTTNGTSVLTDVGAILVGNSGGSVVYRFGNRVWAWTASTGATTLLEDVPPASAVVANHTLVFTQGTSNALYMVTLP